MPKRVKKRVVYLSADADEVLETIEPGDVFVIGGVVDHAPKPDVARRRFLSLRQTFHASSRSSDRRDEVFVKFVTARLPLAGHVSLAKNTHLPCLAVAQTLMVFREVDRYRRAGLFVRCAVRKRRRSRNRDARTR
jgi:tRNA (guanine9-N1)-methyltransferase